MSRKMKSRPGGGSSKEPVPLTSRLAGAFIGLILGGAVGAYFGRKILEKTLHITDSRIWVIAFLVCAAVFAVIGFFAATADMKWNKPIEPLR